VKRLRVAVVVFVLVLLQTSLVAGLPIAGVRGDVVLLFAIAVGIARGRDDGAIAGFAAGLVLDFVVHGTPAGFFALGYTITGYLVGMTQATVLRAAWWIPVVTAVAGSGLGVVVLALLAKMVGIEGFLDVHLVTIAFVVAIVNGALVHPMLRVVRWSMPPPQGAGRLVLS